MNEQNNINTPPTPPHLFSVVDATRHAFLFVSAEWRYLARMSIPVICLQLVLSISLFMFNKDASSFSQFLWEMPAAVFMGWFTFSLVRLIVFGERLDNLPIRDVRFMQYRAGLMKATILISILFKAGITLVVEIATRVYVFTPQEILPAPLIFMMLVFFVISFWAIRFITFPLLSAIDYPLATFLRQAKGLAFSFRVFGLMIMCAFPAFFILNIIVTMVINDPKQITENELLFILAMQAPFSVIISAMMSTGIIFGLREMLGQNAKI